MNSYRWHSTKLMHGARRAAIEPVEMRLSAAVAEMDRFIDRRDWANVRLAYDGVKTIRAEYERLFVCSIHEIEGAAEYETRRGDSEIP